MTGWAIVAAFIALTALVLADRRMTYSSGRNAGRYEVKAEWVLKGYSKTRTQIERVEEDLNELKRRLYQIEGAAGLSQGDDGNGSTSRLPFVPVDPGDLT